jgi:hypothetical protein
LRLSSQRLEIDRLVSSGVRQSRLRSSGNNEDARADCDDSEAVSRRRHVREPSPAFASDVEGFDFVERTVGFTSGGDNETQSRGRRDSTA